jgi:hypothetical protein
VLTLIPCCGAVRSSNIIGHRADRGAGNRHFRRRVPRPFRQQASAKGDGAPRFASFFSISS